MKRKTSSKSAQLLARSPFPLARSATVKQRALAILFVIVIAAIGTYALRASHASGPAAAVEPELGTLSTDATVGSDSAASGGKYVKFGGGTASDPVIVADGDIACDPNASGYNNGNGTSSSCEELATSNLAISLKPAAVLALGDNAYECGGLAAFQESYGPSWGRLLSITHPALGNHEYITGGTVNGVPATDCDSTGQAMGYFNYFGASAGTVGQGYYSFNVGAWHLIALNSNCSKVGGCGSGSPQYTWLQNDLKAHPNQCILAYWHHPLYSRDISGGTANLAGQPFWQLLYGAGADIVLNGHSHNYQRFQPMDPNGNVDTAKGILEIVSGDGGANSTPFDVTDSPATFASKYNFTPGLNQPIPTVSNNSGFGVLELTLHANTYNWQFVPVGPNTFTDSGSGTCHN